MLTEATHRASVIVQDAKAEAAEERARLREEATLEAQRIRDEAVEEIVKLMSTLTTERDHILADARDDARRIVEAAREERDATEGEAEPPVPQGRSASELDELFFSGPEPKSVAQPRPLERRRRKRFRRH